MAHTPGPWEYSLELQKDGSGEAFYLESNGSNFMGACSCCNGTHIDGDAEANARLIAAAPDLLAALQGAEFLIRVSAENSGSASDLAAADYYAEVLARATGAA